MSSIHGRETASRKMLATLASVQISYLFGYVLAAHLPAGAEIDAAKVGRP